MQLPKLLSRFFQNDGAGDKLLKEIMYEALTVGDDDNPICLKDGVLETCHNVGYVEYDISRSGYVKFQNGLIIQWGTALNNAYTAFPISFSTNFIRTVCTEYSQEVEGTPQYHALYTTATQLYPICNDLLQTSSVFYIAIGL